MDAMGDPRRPEAGHDVHPLDDPGDAAALARYAGALADAIDAAIPGWTDRSIRRVLADQHISIDDAVADRISAASTEARSEGSPRVRALLETDVDAQTTNPLSVLRSLVGHATAVLRAAGARPVARDEFRERVFPDDVYDLSPASFSEVDPSLHDPGLVWGAAKAHVHLARRRREGRR
jgi:methionine aminopeptidase